MEYPDSGHVNLNGRHGFPAMAASGPSRPIKQYRHYFRTRPRFEPVSIPEVRV